MHEFWYDYAKCGEKAKLYYMDTDNLIVYIKIYDICKYVGEDIQPRFDTSNQELDGPLHNEKI